MSVLCITIMRVSLTYILCKGTTQIPQEPLCDTKRKRLDQDQKRRRANSKTSGIRYVVRVLFHRMES